MRQLPGPLRFAFKQEVNLLKLGRMPALVILDRAGVLRCEHHANSMIDTAKNSDVLAVLDRLNAEWAQKAPAVSGSARA